MRLTIEADLDYLLPRPADVLLQVEVAAMADQRIETASLTVGSDLPLGAVVGEDGIGQRCWVRGADRLVATYRATVTVVREEVVLAALPATSVRLLPAETVAYLLPSRYCQSDRFEGFVAREFAGLTGGAMAAALVDWTRMSLDYAGDGSTGTTTALDTFASRRGVCRDYAHLLVALARAAEIPARCVAAYAPGVDPPDFHAVAELWLDGAWRLVDPTGMARSDEIARVCVGRDATDIAFMTVFGTATFVRQRVSVRRE
ncbi:transglutaminase-like domain-containing protein [Sphingomonas rubra]|uniref:Transglutaminase-like enzyme, putative cysteine protease n=1 Tax=Sphingomonas rubra TaxID=634430 RepID=A0A1I5T8I7_9SPHN|nr:transglutaminase family protein [Sphingomonas rubra]SFP79352.1 Transglutaminase-like enzyme, putative cysteine protease [Sphingomonas rubra]